MGWFTKAIDSAREAVEPAGNLWTKCPKCEEAVYNRDLEKALFVCPKCGYHFRIPIGVRIGVMLDEGSWQEFDSHLKPADPLKFQALTSYAERIEKAIAKTGANEAIAIGLGTIEGHPVAMGFFNFDFMGGSMGSVVGEKIVRLVEQAIRLRRPLIIVSCSGGARMDEGILSLMQMVKTSHAIARMARERLPFISYLTDPTTGGVTASFAMLGDVIVAEPGALIGFAGPRVIEQTIREKLPEGFQRTEFLLQTGVIDMVLPRQEARSTLARILHFFGAAGVTAAPSAPATPEPAPTT
jgi:acetyl-CoA carboxylase carboxyl transferase subunit beta